MLKHKAFVGIDKYLQLRYACNWKAFWGGSIRERNIDETIAFTVKKSYLNRKPTITCGSYRSRAYLPSWKTCIDGALAISKTSVENVSLNNNQFLLTTLKVQSTRSNAFMFYSLPWKPPSNIDEHVRSWHQFLLALDCFTLRESLRIEVAHFLNGFFDCF